jgi:hypothetical protein
MRRAVAPPAVAVLLLGPFVLAFFSGGYFDEPRAWAGIAVWALVLVATWFGRPLPSSPAGWATLGGLVLITVWSAISLAWAPAAGPAFHNMQRLVLYVGALIAAIGLLRTPRATRAVEPALALGSTVVIGYGLAGRLLPGLVHETSSRQAGSRLEQPLTYWNAEGLLAAMGLVLCARLCGDRSRSAPVRVLAAAVTGPLGVAVYLSYSRGAIAAAVVGLVVVTALAASWSQLRATTIALAAALVAGAVASGFTGVASFHAVTLTVREHNGAIFLAILIGVMAVTGLVGWLALRRERDRRLRVGSMPLPAATPALAGAVVVIALGGLVAGGLRERHGTNTPALAPPAQRLTNLDSNRYEYWRVGLDAFAQHPVLGLGSGGFRVAWLEHRRVPEGVLEIHSLELEMASELGLPGLLGLALFVGGALVAAGRALGRSRQLTAGWCAVAVTWLLHASIDWDWQMPAVTLPVIVAVGGLIAVAQAPEPWTDGQAAASPERRPQVGLAPATGASHPDEQAVGS